MAEKIGKMECKTIPRMPRNKVFKKYIFHFTSFENTIQRQDTMKTWQDDNNLFQTCQQLGTSSANTSCWQAERLYTCMHVYQRHCDDENLTNLCKKNESYALKYSSDIRIYNTRNKQNLHLERVEKNWDCCQRLEQSTCGTPGNRTICIIENWT
jgi:hypothetical protein